MIWFLIIGFVVGIFIGACLTALMAAKRINEVKSDAMYICQNLALRNEYATDWTNYAKLVREEKEEDD